MTETSIISNQSRDHASMLFARPAFAAWPTVFWLLLATTLAMLPAFWYGIPQGADLTNHFRFALPLYDVLRAGETPGWLAESNFGWGDPRFRFYPPGLYYLLCALRWSFGNWHTATLAAFTILTGGRGLGIYFWARALKLKTEAAWWAAGAAIFAPYLLNELYQASFLAEFAACTVLPFAFAFVERIIQCARWRDAAGLGAAYALLIFTHLPVTVIGSLALLAYALLRLPKSKGRPSLLLLAIGVVLGLAASASFWVTMLAELPLIKSSLVAPNPYYDYRNNFLFSPFALTHLNTWYASLLGVLTLAYLAPAVVLWPRKGRQTSLPLHAVWSLCLGACLMTTDLSRPIWWVVPKLKEVQFPFRWLTVASLAGALLLGASVEVWRAAWRQMGPRYFLTVLAFLLAFGYQAKTVWLDTEYLLRPKFEEVIAESRVGMSHKDWLPAMAREVGQMPKMESLVATAGHRGVKVLEWTPQRRSFSVEAGIGEAARVKTYYYPHWQATDGRGRLNVRADENGALLIDLPEQAATVTLEFREPLRSRLAAFLTGAAWLTIALLLWFSYRRQPRLQAATLQ